MSGEAGIQRLLSAEENASEIIAKVRKCSDLLSCGGIGLGRGVGPFVSLSGLW